MDTLLWVTVVVCLYADYVLFKTYVKPNDNRRDFYGTIRYNGHVILMKLFIYIGILGICCKVACFVDIIPYISLLIGIISLMVSPFTLYMGNKSYGDRNITVSGYHIYTMFFFKSGVMALIYPSSDNWVKCWVLAHAYASCRLFTSILWKFRNYLSLSHKSSYTYALMFASIVVLFFAEGIENVISYILLSITIQILFRVFGIYFYDKEHTFKGLFPVNSVQEGYSGIRRLFRNYIKLISIL